MTEDQQKLNDWVWKHAKIEPKEPKIDTVAPWMITLCVLGILYAIGRHYL